MGLASDDLETMDMREVTPFVTEIHNMDPFLNDDQREQILSQIQCFLSDCPCSLQVRPHHGNEGQKISVPIYLDINSLTKQ